MKNNYFSLEKRKNALIGYLFIIPMIIGFFLFIIYPLIFSIYYSFCEWPGAGKEYFVGLDNYIYMFTKDPSFIKSITATAFYVVLTVPTGLAISLLIAMLLNNNLKGIKVFRTLFYLPVVIPAVTTLTLWKLIFHQDFGLLNMVLNAFGQEGLKWIESEALAMPSMAIVRLWLIGSFIIVLLGGLQSVPSEIHDAAKVDGAPFWTKLFKITIPIMSPIIFLQLIYGTILALHEFNAPAILTKFGKGVSGGGPNYATYLMAYSIYDNAFENRMFGYAMAQSVFLFLFIIILSAVLYKYFQKKVFYESGNF